MPTIPEQGRIMFKFFKLEVPDQKQVQDSNPQNTNHLDTQPRSRQIQRNQLIVSGAGSYFTDGNVVSAALQIVMSLYDIFHSNTSRIDIMTQLLGLIIKSAEFALLVVVLSSGKECDYSQDSENSTDYSLCSIAAKVSLFYYLFLSITHTRTEIVKTKQQPSSSQETVTATANEEEHQSAPTPSGFFNLRPEHMRSTSSSRKINRVQLFLQGAASYFPAGKIITIALQLTLSIFNMLKTDTSRIDTITQSSYSVLKLLEISMLIASIVLDEPCDSYQQSTFSNETLFCSLAAKISLFSYVFLSIAHTRTEIIKSRGKNNPADTTNSATHNDNLILNGADDSDDEIQAEQQIAL